MCNGPWIVVKTIDLFQKEYPFLENIIEREIKYPGGQTDGKIYLRIFVCWTELDYNQWVELQSNEFQMIMISFSSNTN